jgi:tRNA modification GTPase
MQRTYLDAAAPIAALATPRGSSALAVIRAAGPGSVELAASCFSRPDALRAAPGHSLVHGFLVDPASREHVDEVLAAVYRGPNGPFGSDGVEFSCHGSPAVVRRALAALEAAGFAPALPGEFSFRAFVEGRLDLLRAEAIAELSRARTELGRAEALARLEGGLSRRVAAARAALVDLLAEVQARLDHPDDETDVLDGDVPSAIESLRARIADLAAGYAAGRLHGEGALVVIAGRPNAGKSSLFNLILREERAIVDPEPGTTRDWIEAEVELGGIALRFADTAGLRDAPDGPEAQGVARSRELASRADAALYLVDCRSGLRAEDESFLASRPDAVRVWSKWDGESRPPVPPGFLGASAQTGEGLPELLETVRSAVSARAEPDGPDAVRIASERQKALLDRAAAALGAALASIVVGAGLDAAFTDLTDASDALGEMTGEIASEEVLTAIFSRFCLGK